ncbi:MAG: LCCL domain-containing protein [Cyanobacteria bacterium P01_D01_bin.128]
MPTRSTAMMSVLLAAIPLAIAVNPPVSQPIVSTAGLVIAQADSPTTRIADWSETAAEYQGQVGRQIRYSCIPNGSLSSVWGTDIYTDDSSICSAAVHAGLINQSQGGNVIIEIAPGEIAYEGTTRNGVTSTEWGRWDGSFVFVD